MLRLSPTSLRLALHFVLAVLLLGMVACAGAAGPGVAPAAPPAPAG